ncbi:MULTISPECIES: DUF6745 domain-containing protein [Nostoc]|uniref:DUF6745 domain-containing protein n=1 Tax=Nostoc paludosum FACHB-159 TaxID=2692908 RepID=A0ABR8KE67_9NOSO|nr:MULTISPECIES: hypothetical protein [Nostoc]MBD2682241.1 hypothetical protein [Nostoc sp. FACHB-857]MBD2736590.1 hypothetical protein [Nostoc paludosum FACHB-159]
MSADNLTPKQRTFISQCREKWQHIGLSTERINQQHATDAVRAIYTALELTEPEIIIVDSPNTAIAYIWNLIKVDSETILNDVIDSSFWSRIYRNLHSHLLVRVPVDLQKNLHLLFENNLATEYAKLLQEQLKIQWEDILEEDFGKGVDVASRSGSNLIKNIFSSCRKPETLIAGCSYFDFCIHSLKYQQFQNQLLILEEFVKNCGWTFFFKNIAIISNRATTINIDSNNHLHGEDTPAVAFADEYTLDAHHGKINLQRKKRQLDDIAWTKLFEKMNAVEIDSWEEYKLLRVVKEGTNVRPQQFLKVTNPHTGEVRVFGVSMRFTSAIEAARWVNQRKTQQS